MFRRSLLAVLVLIVSPIWVSDALAQRQGFIIGFGLGPGVNSYSVDFAGVTFDSERQTSVGVATDFKIGGHLGKSVHLYYSNKVVFSSEELVDLIAVGVSGLGVTYVLPSAPVHISGSIGFAVFAVIDEGETTSESGLGLTAGIGYEFADRWIVDFGLGYGKPGNEFMSINVLQAKVGINILSH